MHLTDVNDVFVSRGGVADFNFVRGPRGKGGRVVIGRPEEEACLFIIGLGEEER